MISIGQTDSLRDRPQKGREDSQDECFRSSRSSLARLSPFPPLRTLATQASKKESRGDKGSVKIWELDNDVYRDSLVKSDTDESSDSIHSFSTTLSFVDFLRPATLAFVPGRSYPFSSSPFCQISFKKNRPTKKLSAVRNTRVFGDSRVNFTTKFNGSKLSKRWLAQLSENPVEGVYLRSKRFFLVLFSRINFFASGRH